MVTAETAAAAAAAAATTDGSLWLVSANPFDVVGCRAAGLPAAWIDRASTGWIDRLGDVVGGLGPTVVASGVDQAVREILRLSS